jgi:hypothetical protein
LGSATTVPSAVRPQRGRKARWDCSYQISTLHFHPHASILSWYRSSSRASGAVVANSSSAIAELTFAGSPSLPQASDSSFSRPILSSTACWSRI